MTESNSIYKVFVGNVPYTCGQDEFVSCFDKCDGYLSAEVIMRLDGTLTRGFGFVVLDSEEHVNNLLQQEIYLTDRLLRLDNYSSDGKENNKQRHMDTFKIFLRNVPSTTTGEDLEKHFSTYGTVTECRLNIRDDNTEPFVTAVVTFDQKDSLLSALTDRETDYEGTSIKIYPFNKKNRRSTRNTSYGNYGSYDNSSYGNSSYGNNSYDNSSYDNSSYRGNGGFGGENAIYRAGFKAGRAIGFEEGKKEGLPSSSDNSQRVFT